MALNLLYMKKTFLSIFFLFSAICVWAQNDILFDYNQNRLEKQRKSMLILGTWAVGNIAAGAALYGQHEGSERQFHIMNAGWNVVNLGLATLGYFNAMKTDPSSLGLFESIEAQNAIEKTFLFNGGLDVGYMLGGLYLMERAKTADKNADQLKGFGKSIVLQGAFLFVFDLAAYFWQNHHAQDISPLLSGLYFDGQQFGFSLVF